MNKKFVRANQAPYMAKVLRKAIMRRAELETKYFKVKNERYFESLSKTEKLLQQTIQERKEKFL